MIYLIRHGETEANLKHIYCGSTDLPLSEEGIRKLEMRRNDQAIATLRGRVAASCGSGLSGNNETAGALTVITSGMRRTEQTLEVLLSEASFDDVEKLQELTLSNVKHVQDYRFREIDFGAFEMHSYYELKNTSEYQEWISGDNEENVCPGGESGRQMEVRVMSAFDELREHFLQSVDSSAASENVSVESGVDVYGDATDVVVVTHGGVIAAVMSNLFPKEDKTRFEWQPAPGCGYVIVSESEHEEL